MSLASNTEDSIKRLNENIRGFLLKSLGLNTKLKEIFEKISSPQKTEALREDIHKLINDVNDTDTLISKINYDDIPEEIYIAKPKSESKPIQQQIKNNEPQVFQVQQPGSNISQLNNNQSSVNFQQPLNQPPAPNNQIKNQQFNPNQQINQSNIVYPNQNFSSNSVINNPYQQPNVVKQELNPMMNSVIYNPKLDENQKSDILKLFSANSKIYDYIISIRLMTKEIIIYYKNTFHSVALQKDLFFDSSKYFTEFPEFCRYTNLGCSLFVTGGIINKQPTNKCFIVLTTIENNTINCNISNFPSMKESRERHNIIYLEDKNKVLVCSGFFKCTVEIADLNLQSWSSLPNLKEARANSTMAYIDNRFVYLIGGYKSKYNSKDGEYLNSVEIMDMQHCKNGWKVIELGYYNYKLGLCSMGIITLNTDRIIACGGFDGLSYSNKGHEIEIDTCDGGIKSIKESTFQLPYPQLFSSNQFLRVGNQLFNVDHLYNCVSFKPSTGEFNIIKAN